MDDDPTPRMPPILVGKRHAMPSAFTPQNLLQEARRRKALEAEPVPAVCLLDPDGDMVDRLTADGRAAPCPHWPCDHTTLHRFDHDGRDFGIIGRAVGAPFAVLVAEQLFAAGCRLLISMTSAGQVMELRPPPYFVLIERALRDEGTSYHYLPLADYSHADPALLERLAGAFDDLAVPVDRGAAWTTDAPFRETPQAIDLHRAAGILAVEMEAAALYAFARARGHRVVCFAHVTNRMARVPGDFDKGAADGTTDALAVVAAAARTLGA